MAWDLETAKIKAGIDPADTTQDVALDLAMQQAVAVSERYCDRGLSLADPSLEVFNYFNASQVRLWRYPVIVMAAVLADGVAITDYKLNGNTGQILFPSTLYAGTLEVQSEAGYGTFPPDLELALWQIFGAVWALNNSQAGSGTQDVKSLKIDGVGQVTYASDSGTSETGIPGLISDAAAGMLEPYKSKSC
jgi:hypothetical protein